MKRASTTLIILATALIPSQLRAADLVDLGRAGSWTIARSENACLASNVFEGPGHTQLTFAKTVAGDIYVFTANDNWTILEGEKYDTTFYVDGEEFSGDTSTGGKGWLTDSFKPEFEAWFAAGNGLTIELRGQPIARLSLRGSAAALAKVNACHRQMFASLSREARDAIRFRDIPINPFAPATLATAPAPSAPHGVRPLDLQRWATRIQENYPPSAIRGGLEGRVSIRLDISPAGRVSGCSVVESSGHLVLDEAACQGARLYARFEPATDETGTAVSGSYVTTVAYALN